MPTFLIALASALLLAALVTEVTQRFWPDSYLALLVITSVALLVNGLFNARLRQAPEAAAPEAKPEPARQPQGGRRTNNRDSKSQGAKNQDRGSERRQKPDRPRPDKQRADKQKTDQQKADKQEAPSPAKPAAKERDQDAETAPRGPQETGTVKWFNRSKGYGFIIRDNGDEVFVHQRSIISEGDRKQRPVLRDGQKVSFVVAHLEKGAQAEQVQGLD